MTAQADPGPVTAQSAQTWETAREDPNVALMTVLFDGAPATVVVAISRDGEDYIVSPLYLEVGEDIMARLSPAIPQTGD